MLYIIIKLFLNHVNLKRISDNNNIVFHFQVHKLTNALTAVATVEHPCQSLSTFEVLCSLWVEASTPKDTLPPVYVQFKSSTHHHHHLIHPDETRG